MDDARHAIRASQRRGTWLREELLQLLTLAATLAGLCITGVALFHGGWAIDQLWVFWLVPLIGGIVGGLIYRYLLESRE